MEPLWIRLDVGSDSVRIIIEILLSTFLVLLFAEFLPRAIFRARANVLLSRLAQLIDIFYQMFYPIAAACIALANWLLKYVFNVKVDKRKRYLAKRILNIFFVRQKKRKMKNNL
jgi:CBS domain containing-hemolysin-like protein